MSAALDLSPPVIDVGALAGHDRAAQEVVARALRQACVSTGFFYVTNHGIDAAEVDGLFATAKRFFDQTDAIKNRVAMKNSRWNRGFDGIGNQQLNAATGFDRKESYFIGIDYGADHPRVKANTPYYGPNQWPENLPGWRERVLGYFGAVEALSRRLMNGVALSLDLPWGYFDPASWNTSRHCGCCTTHRIPMPIPRARSAVAPIPTGARSPSWRRTKSADSRFNCGAASGSQRGRYPVRSSSISGT